MTIQKRQIRAARKAKQLRLARWNNVPYMRSKFALADLRDRNTRNQPMAAEQATINAFERTTAARAVQS